MHSFPRARRPRVYAVVVACLVAIGPLLQPPASAIPDDELKDRRRELRAGIASAAEDLEGASVRVTRAVLEQRSAEQKLSAARLELRELRRDLSDAQRQDALMRTRLNQAEEELSVATSNLAEGRQAVARQRRQVSDMIASIYTEGNPQVLALSALIRSQTAADLTRQSMARDVLVGKETDAYEELTTAEQSLETTKSTVHLAALEVGARREQAADQLVWMTDLEEDAATTALSVAELVQVAEQATADARRAIKADRAVLYELQAEDIRVRDVLRRRADRAREKAAADAAAAAEEATNEPSPQSPGEENSDTPPASDSTAVLSWPINGRVTSPFGYRHHPIYGYWGLHDGIDIADGCGTRIYAPAAGEVISSVFQSAYGNRMIIDHGLVNGVGLATIYNHSASYDVNPGELVKKGQLIGYVGNTGWSTGCHLHFTVMADGTPVDPMNWL